MTKKKKLKLNFNKLEKMPKKNFKYWTWFEKKVLIFCDEITVIN